MIRVGHNATFHRADTLTVIAIETKYPEEMRYHRKTEIPQKYFWCGKSIFASAQKVSRLRGVREVLMIKFPTNAILVM